MLDWTAAVEADALARARAGLYPVDRAHPLADGKCGLKAILYMANGVPPIVTPTPTNATIVRDGVDGLHATTDDEWTACVQQVLDDDDLWTRLRRDGHRRVRDEYSLAVWGPRVAAHVRRLIV